VCAVPGLLKALGYVMPGYYWVCVCPCTYPQQGGLAVAGHVCRLFLLDFSVGRDFRPNVDCLILEDNRKRRKDERRGGAENKKGHIGGKSDLLDIRPKGRKDRFLINTHGP